MHMEQSEAVMRGDLQETAPYVAAPSPGDFGRILIVDDNQINRRVLIGMLDRKRYRLLSAADGAEALAIARNEPPDLILLDIMMPGKDGYEVCAELKADPRTERVPVIFLSALSETADKIKGLELGAVDYITKPFDQGEVLARVRCQLKIQRLSSEVLRANRELCDKQERIDEDLKAAGAIQRSLVPSAPPPGDRLRLAWRFMPCGRVGGDLFNFCPLNDAELAVFVIDVSGHGVPAAMVTVSLSQFLSLQAGHLLATPAGADAVPRAARPAEVLQRLDDEYPMERFDKYFTIAYALVDHRAGRLRYSLGGHPQPVLLRADGRLEILEAGGPLIGIGAGLGFDEAEVPLERGDRLFLYTDGIVELADPTGAQFGEQRLYDAVYAARRLPLDAACEQLLETALAFGAGCEPQDDITLLALEVTGGAGTLPT
jgi:sigma-B regulation protein RsbU (phosphoserine phosphatase)